MQLDILGTGKVAIASARGPEHYFMMFAAIMQSLRSPAFNIRLVTP